MMGDLTAGFQIKTFSDQNFNDNISEGLMLGAEIFVEISWSLQTAQNLRFIVKDCYADFDVTQIDIIGKDSNKS